MTEIFTTSSTDFKFPKSKVHTTHTDHQTARLKTTHEARSIITSCEELALNIEKNREDLILALTSYESWMIANYEITRSIYTLRSVYKNDQYYKVKADTISSFLPFNLPLYSLILFGVIPAFMTRKNLILRPNTEMRRSKLIETLSAILNLSVLCPKISISSLNSSDFILKIVSQSDVVIFTGIKSNRDKIINVLKPGSILIYNGSGHNPIVVSSDAQLNLAVKQAVYTKFFNSGQDCAGPDAILVHKDVVHIFVELFLEEVKKLQIGEFSDPRTCIGPITRKTELLRLLELIHDVNATDIIYGGRVDVKTRIVEPTVVHTNITNYKNYTEVFGPVAFIHTYNDDIQLSEYFEDSNGRYNSNKMYVSLFGSSEYLKSRNDSLLAKRNGVGIILDNMSVHDYERGDKAYGGYSNAASCIIAKNKEGRLSTMNIPIYIPEVISKHCAQEPSIREKASNNKMRKARFNIVKDFIVEVHSCFSDNLVFAFIFGSTATGTGSFSGSKRSDLDTFICLRERSQSQELYFKKWLFKAQYKVGLRPDLDFPCEVMTLDKLTKSMSWMTGRSLDLYFNTMRKFDAVIWLEAMSEKKVGVTGDVEKLSSLSKLAAKEMKRLVGKLQEDLLLSKMPSEKIKQTFAVRSLGDYNQVCHEVCSGFELKQEKLGKLIDRVIPLGSKKATVKEADAVQNGYYQKVSSNKASRSLSLEPSELR